MENPGKVYILQNKRVSGLVKIGKTNQLDRRLEKLNTGAGVAGRWEVAGYVITEDMGKLEIATHKILHSVRDGHSGGSEIFDCSPEEAGIAILEAAEENGIEIFRDKLPQTVKIARERVEADKVAAELTAATELAEARWLAGASQRAAAIKQEWLDNYHSQEHALAKYIFRAGNRRKKNPVFEKLYEEAVSKHGHDRVQSRLKHYATID